MNDTLRKQTQSIASRLTPEQSDAERCCAEQDLRALALRSFGRGLLAATMAAAGKAVGVVMGALPAPSHREHIEDRDSPALR